MSGNVIETDNLTRYYDAKKVVDSLELTVPQGSVFALLGRNGSGKTTTIRILLGLLEPTRGSSTVLGRDSQSIPPSVRAQIAYINEEHYVHGWMTVEQLERYQAQFYPAWSREIFQAVIEHFRLERSAKARHLSRGQRAGLCLALTLAQQPRLLILDDPALGLDAVVRRSLLEAMVFVTRDSERTILFSSHILSEVERVADRIAILDRGVLRANCAVETFRQRVRRVCLYFDRLPDVPGMLSRLVEPDRVTFTVANWGEEAERLLRELEPARLEDTPLSLEEAFISYVEERGDSSFLLGKLGGVL
jgi:ABC-2 type transport system ATP-binding protein